MSKLPCAICETFPSGALRKTYLTFYLDEEPQTYRLSACKSCSEDARNPWLEWGDQKLEDGSWKQGNSRIAELAEQRAVVQAIQSGAVPNAARRSSRGGSRPTAEHGSAGSTEP